jgi:copper resistance protein B
MKRLLILLAGTAASPALAQHQGHAQPTPAPSPAPATSCTPEHAAMGHCKMPATQLPPRPAPAATCTPEHAAMGHCTLPPPPPAPEATCTPEHAAMGHCTMPPPPPAAAQTCTAEHAAMGHCTMAPQSAAPPASADPHAGHQISEAAAAPSVGPPPAEALSGPAHAQDLFYDPGQAARSRAHMVHEHGGMSAYKFLIDQAEVNAGDRGEGYAWDAQFWYGGDIDKLWLKSEGEGLFGEALEQGEVQALYSRAVDPWFDVQAGIRQDFGAGSDRTHVALGVQGLAPYWFEVEATAFLSTEGELTARIEAEYDLRLTKALILQPKAELDLSLQDMPDIGIGGGLSTASLGARLRYEFFPDSGPAVIAPYVGLEYEQAFGSTADYREAEGEETGGVRALAGLRIWF